jgi:hypothetical protein
MRVEEGNRVWNQVNLEADSVRPSAFVPNTNRSKSATLTFCAELTDM